MKRRKVECFMLLFLLIISVNDVKAIVNNDDSANTKTSAIMDMSTVIEQNTADNPENPNTGVFLPLTSFLILSGLGIFCFRVSGKMKKFNRI